MEDLINFLNAPTAIHLWMIFVKDLLLGKGGNTRDIIFWTCLHFWEWYRRQCECKILSAHSLFRINDWKLYQYTYLTLKRLSQTVDAYHPVKAWS